MYRGIIERIRARTPARTIKPTAIGETSCGLLVLAIAGVSGA
jgi:hypothetical protein